MKWTKEQEEKLCRLCFKEKTNAELAKIFNCDIKDIHAARSRLGVTIPKVKAAKEAHPQYHTANTSIDPWDNIGAAFDQLDKALLATAAEDPINEPVLRQVAQGISIFKAMLLNAVD